MFLHATNNTEGHKEIIGKLFHSDYSELKVIDGLQKKLNINPPDEESENYLKELLVYKDKLYRFKKILRMINCADIEEYINFLIEISTDMDNLPEIENGELCKKCGKKSAVNTQKQLRAGDEGAASVIFCTNRNCHHIEKKSS